MSDSRDREVLHIKKYPNRRYYDTTRSRHITLQEVHDAIISGKDVCITDSRTGEDITNVVLTQILLEKDPPKLDVFPTSMFLIMIRSNPQLLRRFLEPILGPFLGMFSSSQRQFDQYLRQVMGGGINPLEWASQIMMRGFQGNPDASEAASPPGGLDEWEPEGDASPTDTELADLRRQVAELTRKIEDLSARGGQDNRPAA